jgi:hypothetical protein
LDARGWCESHSVDKCARRWLRIGYRTWLSQPVLTEIWNSKPSLNWQPWV